MTIPSDPSLSSETLAKAQEVQVLDKDGKSYTFGDLTQGKRVALIFIRHFWCINCQEYTSQVGVSIPPSNLPEGTSVIIIGCGSSQPIDSYLQTTKSPYPIYTNPTLELYNLFGFKSNIKGNTKGSEKGYENHLAESNWGRVWAGMKAGPFTNIGHFGKTGPVSQNGGEVVLEEDGSCSFFHVMQNSADHLEITDLAEVIGAKYVPLPEDYVGPGGGSGRAAAAAALKGSCNSDGTSCEVKA